MKRFEAWLRDAAERAPQHTALVCGEQRLSYAEFDSAVEACAAGLVHAAGLQRFERCVLFADNRVETCIGIFASLRAGAVFSVINPSTKAAKLGYVLADCEARVLVTQASRLPVAIEAAVLAPSVRQIVVIDDFKSPPCRRPLLDWQVLLQSAPQPLPAAPRGLDIDLAMLVYTSGSTGQPKGVMMTHQNVQFAAESIFSYLQVDAEDVVLSVLPLAFDYGLYQLLMAVRCGYTLVLERSFAFPQKVLPLLARERVTGFSLVPTLAAMLVQLKRFDPSWSAPLRFLTNTAAALPPAHIARLQQLFPSARIFSMYGMTESKRCTWLPPEELQRRPDSVGIAIPGTEVWVADDAGQPLPANTVGELVVRGGHVMQGYWRNEVATARTLKASRYPSERVLHTGDLFKMDAEGFFYFVGRKDDIIKSRGEKVSPKEVEAVLYALPGIREAAVVGVPDAILGAALRALVVLADDAQLSARQILLHCRQQLEDFMVPRDIEFRDALPKTSTGKIQRARLQAEAENRPFVED